MISNVKLKENEDVVKKLERILDICNNTRDNIEKMIAKYSSHEADINEDLNSVSVNLSAIMNFIDPIFKLYLVMPNNTENENGI